MVRHIFAGILPNYKYILKFLEMAKQMQWSVLYWEHILSRYILKLIKVFTIYKILQLQLNGNLKKSLM